jgi:hypothetical protein
VIDKLQYHFDFKNDHIVFEAGGKRILFDTDAPQSIGVALFDFAGTKFNLLPVSVSTCTFQNLKMWGKGDL